MWSSFPTLPFEWCSKPSVALDHHHQQSLCQDVPVLSNNNNNNTVAILYPRRLQRHQQRLIRRQQSTGKHIGPDEAIPHQHPTKLDLEKTRNNSHSYSCKTLSNYCHSRSNISRLKAAHCIDNVTVDACVSDSSIVTTCEENVLELARWARCRRVKSSAVRAGWRFILGVALVLQSVLMTGVRRFLARFSGRRRSYIPPSPHHHKTSPWRILALIFVSTSLISIVDGCSSRNTPKPRPPPTPATAAATTARPNITFLTYECPPAYAAWYCLNGATCFTVKIGDSLLYNCECSEGYMGPRCEYKDLDGSYLPSQRRILLETASIAGGATIAVLLMVVLGLVAYVHYCRRQRKEEPPTPPASLTAAQSTLTTTTDSVDGVTRTVTTSCNKTQVPRRLPTFGTRWKTQNQQQQQQQNLEHNVIMTRIDLQQVTTLLGDCENAQTQQSHAQLQRQC